MGTPYFNRDESFILTAHKVKFDSAMSDAMLTSQRLILIDAGYAQFRPQIIPLETIETVIPGEDAYGNPIITLSLAATTPGGATQSKELVFSQQTGGGRKQECNEWVKRLKEQVTSVRLKASLTTKTPTDLDTDIIFDDTITTGTDHVPDGLIPPLMRPAPQKPVVTPPQKDIVDGEVSPDHAKLALGGSGAASATESSLKIPLSSRFHPTPALPHKPNFSIIAAIIIVIVAVAVGVFVYSNILQGTPSEPPGTVTTLPITPAETTAATPVPTTIVPEQTYTPIVTPAPTTEPRVIIPDTGVWVRVQYAGNFSGEVGLPGGMRQVSGSGDQFYQIPTIDGLVEVTIQKQDGSGSVLAVEVYKNGNMVKRSTVAAPRGTIEIHVDLNKV